ncbi:hypothetical protein C4578_00890 [Candidatus Microgenomates bacterium]|jgi:hypothetical protein|nr:MAG: hypothetical protein C4578_00890 [Candidatus Microgenomates bacterium]
MRKIFLFVSLFAFSLTLARTALAQTEARTQEQQRLRISPMVTGAQVRNEEQNQVRTQDEEGLLDSRVEKEHMNIVSQKVQEILASGTPKGGIGEEVSEIARSQNQAQEEIREHIGKLDTRPGWLRSVIGPDFKAIRNIRQEVEQNQVRITKLEELKSKLVNQTEISTVEEMVKALVQENTSLQERISFEEDNPGIFGWLFRLF